MNKYYCPDSEQNVTVVLDRRECRQLFRTMNNASRWEDLSDIDREFKNICQEMESHCDSLDRAIRQSAEDDYMNRPPSLDDDEDVGIPNEGLDSGVDE